MMATRTQPEDYYKIRDRVLELMADQAGRPFDATNFGTQFRKAAIEYGYKPYGDGYLPRFIQVKKWVKNTLPKKPRGGATTAPPPTPRAWYRDPDAFDPRLAQLPPSDRE